MRRAALGLCLWLAGCDPTAGLADSADAAVPEEKRYFDGRGSQLSEGPWHRVVVDLDVDTLYHVGARRLDDEQPTFHLFGADDREGCQVAPNTGTWLMRKPADAPFRVLPFLESADENGLGRLRFTTLGCQVQDLVVEGARRPYPVLYDNGYLVVTENGYTFADPWRNRQWVVAGSLQRVVTWDPEVVVLLADERLKSFSAQFEPGSEWGNAAVAAMPSTGNDTLVEDADGLHHVTLDRATLALDSEPILPDACHLQRSSIASFTDGGRWVSVQMPCDNPRPTLVFLDVESFEPRDSLELPFEADARYTRSMLRKVSGDEAEQLVVFYLTDVDADGRGTLWAWHQGLDAPIKLGEHAALDSTYVTDPDTPWDGGAQVNYRQVGSYGIQDWMRFEWDGTTTLVAEGVLSAPSGDLLVNFNGTAGDLPVYEGDGFGVLARGVPPSLGALTSIAGARHYARVDRFGGDSGRLLLGTEGSPPSDWTPLATDVSPELVRFAPFMPALVFVEHWDEGAGSGDLVAYNYQLDARSTIAQGVSSFDLTSYPLDGVAYTVPSGKQRGIWFSKAK